MSGQSKSKKKPLKSDKLLKTNQMAPLPAYAQEKVPEEPEELTMENMTVSGVYRMIEKYRKMHDQVERQLDDLYQKSGFNPKQIKDYLANPNNFNENQWEYLQNRRQEFNLSFNVQRNDGVSPLKAMANKDASAEPKARRGKGVALRRNWIQVR